MTRGRFAGTCAVAFLVSQVLAIAVHGFILRADYLPFYGTLLRPMEGDGQWQMVLLPVSHLLFVIALVWVYTRVTFAGSSLARGTALGSLGFLIGQAPHWLLWYAEQPWPGELVVKQLALEWLSSIVIGLVIVAMAQPGRVDRPAMA